MSLTKRQLQIVDRALEIVDQEGMKRLTLKNLASRLGVTEPAIYRHFAGKSAIIQAMIAGFDADTDGEEPAAGLSGIEAFVKARFRDVAERPVLARVLFGEELFMDDPEASRRMLAMMHRHRDRIFERIDEGVRAGEIRGDVDREMLFRLIMGPVRLLVKQWGLSGRKFDIVAKGDELWQALATVIGGKNHEEKNRSDR